MTTLNDAEKAAVTRTQARIDADADGDNTVVAAVTGKQIRVITFIANASGAGVITLKSGANVLAEFDLASKGGEVLRGSYDDFLFQTNAGEALIINNPAGVDTNGLLVYVLV